MNRIGSFMGRRQFLVAAGVTSMTALISGKLTGIFNSNLLTGTANATEKNKMENIDKMKVSDRFRMPQRAIDELLSPGYAPIEIGYEQLENGDALVCNRTRFDNCNGKILDWWMSEYLQGTKEYQLWHQDHTTFKWDEHKNPGTFIGATHMSGEYIDGVFIPMWISFYDPAEILGMTEYPDKKISSVTCLSVWLKDRNLSGSLLQVVRDTYYGCEMRMRFCMVNMKVEDCRGMLVHSMDEMANLAGFLPSLYAREQQRKASNPRL